MKDTKEYLHSQLIKYVRKLEKNWRYENWIIINITNYTWLKYQEMLIKVKKEQNQRVYEIWVNV